MGQHHARIFSGFHDVSLVAVCDTNLKTAKSLAKTYKTRYYLNHKELIKKEDLDAASIAVPTKYHLPVALDFIKERIPLLVEKPLADTSMAAKKIIDAARKKKVVLSVGHIERYNPAIIQLQKIVSKKLLGEILSINIKRVGLFPTRVMDVSVLIDLAVHDLDIANTLVKRTPDFLYARGSGALTKGKYDHAEIFLDFKDFGCFIQVNWVTPIKIRQLSITGTKGYAELNYLTQELLVYKSIYKISQPEGFKEFVIKFGNPKTRQVKVKNQEPLKIELRNFIDSVKNKTKPNVSDKEALAAIILAEMAEKSIRTRKVLKYKLSI